MLNVTEDQEITGQQNGDVIVQSGAHLEVYGQVNGRVQVAVGASAGIHGRLNGDLESAGTVDVTGVLNGRAILAGGQITIAVGACLLRGSQTLMVTAQGTFEPPRGSHMISEDTPRWQVNADGTLSPASYPH
ncbi:hypothetical protein ABZX12_02880 [Kribbella sp. NPDC003505]|uniref:hypothetical protein n=1 Tax=Kribbella sp. NPDC003505 TaxID=3154448 RepID=UPI0033AC3383